jgi:hypothetical protein
VPTTPDVTEKYGSEVLVGAVAEVAICIVNEVGVGTLWTRKVPFRFGMEIASETVTRPLAATGSTPSPWEVGVVNVTVLPDTATLVRLPSWKLQFGTAEALAKITS